MDTETFELAKSRAEICRVFGNPNRVLILWTLGMREMSVSAIASVIDASLQNTSQHLRLMKDKNILTSRRVGNTIFYRVKQNDSLMDCQVFAQGQQIARSKAHRSISYFSNQEDTDDNR